MVGDPFLDPSVPPDPSGMQGFRDITNEVPRDEEEAADADTLGGSLPYAVGPPPVPSTAGPGIPS